MKDNEIKVLTNEEIEEIVYKWLTSGSTYGSVAIPALVETIKFYQSKVKPESEAGK